MINLPHGTHLDCFHLEGIHHHPVFLKFLSVYMNVCDSLGVIPRINYRSLL